MSALEDQATVRRADYRLSADPDHAEVLFALGFDEAEGFDAYRVVRR